jgi:very-short-patch-repair endonuclease
MFKPASADNIQRARELRRGMTKFERKLWFALRTLRPRGFHFRRQSPFRGYYLDFVEHDAKLVIEIDGSQHFDAEQVMHDKIRDRVLAREGYATLRFDNSAIDKNIDGVLEIIWGELQGRGQLPPPGALANTLPRASLRAPTSPQRGR